MIRKREIVVWLLAMVMFGGCATTQPIWFIATPGYVEARIAASEEAIRQEYELEISRLQNELNAQRAVADELRDLSDTIEEIESDNEELLGLADELEERLAEIPQETIRQIVEILQQFLDEN